MPQAAGRDLSIRGNCIKFHDGGNCDGSVLGQTDVISSLVSPGHCEETGRLFDTVFYSDDCGTGPGGRYKRCAHTLRATRNGLQIEMRGGIMSCISANLIFVVSIILTQSNESQMPQVHLAT